MYNLIDTLNFGFLYVGFQVWGERFSIRGLNLETLGLEKLHGILYPWMYNDYPYI